MAKVTITIQDDGDHLKFKVTSKPPFANLENPAMANAAMTGAQKFAAGLFRAILDDLDLTKADAKTKGKPR